MHGRAQFPPSRFLPPRDFDRFAQARLALAAARAVTRVEQFALHSIKLGLVQSFTGALDSYWLVVEHRDRLVNSPEFLVNLREYRGRKGLPGHAAHGNKPGDPRFHFGNILLYFSKLSQRPSVKPSAPLQPLGESVFLTERHRSFGTFAHGLRLPPHLI